MSSKPKIYLSSPHLGSQEFEFVREAFATNWIAPLGPHVDGFEREFCERLNHPAEDGGRTADGGGRTAALHAAALSSGTAALHLALKLVGLQRGDEVFCSSLTFSASANPIAYEGGQPVFIDCERASWNMDPVRLAEALEDRHKKGTLPRAVIVVHLYGQCADLDAIMALCERYGVAVIEDAAEALGAIYFSSEQVSKEETERTANQGSVSSVSSWARKTLSPGTLGKLGIFSFNGNKIITTSGGGMLVSPDEALIKKARFLATQARDPAPHYQHSEIGYNYRLSNVLAGIGRGQLQVLADRVNARRANCVFYEKAFADLPGISFMPEAPWNRCTRWLTCILVDPAAFGADREAIRLALEAENIEARPVWKPMHLQPVFAGCDRFGGEVAEDLFNRGLCLPSGSNLTEADLARVVEVVRRVFARR
jgi:dTDP-4-amino-4,6-dideoxygalactose transaminase